MNRQWIYDKNSSPTGFPLDKLLRFILSNCEPISSEVVIHRAEGYGEVIQKWDSMLFAPDDRVVTNLDTLKKLFELSEENIYWLDVEIRLKNGNELQFGLHDSTAMYLESELDASEEFRDVRI